MTEAIVFENVYYSYPDGQKALNGVSASIKEGETVCVIGPNGAGKSTLLLSLLGFLSFKGKITVHGKEVKKKNFEFIRKTIGLVFQDPDDQLFMPGVFEDVVFGPLNFFSPEEAQKKALEALEAVDLRGFEERLAHHLSFGEKKRVAIAGVLALQPSIMVLDEPTSNLDHFHRRNVINAIKNMDGTKLIATHDLDLVAEVAIRIIILKAGVVVSEGSPYKILSNESLLRSALLERPCQCKLQNLKKKESIEKGHGII